MKGIWRMPRLVVFRVDGGSTYSVAMGHTYRCMRLARSVQSRGVASMFYMRDYPEGVELIRGAGFPVTVLPLALSEAEEAGQTVAYVEAAEGVLFVDLRFMNPALVRLARQRGVPTVVYEDVKGEELGASVVINPTDRGRDLYRGGSTMYLLGNKYVVLDPDLARHRRSTFSPDLKRLFVCFGGADPCNLTSRVVRCLIDKEIVVDVALGPAFCHDTDFVKGMDSRNRRAEIRLLRGCNELPSRMAEADATITSGGTIVYESVALRLPTLALPTIGHEAHIVSSLMERGLVMGLPSDAAKVDNHVLRDAIDGFFGDRQCRRKCFAKQGEADYSLGAARVTDAICALLGQDEK